MRILGVDPGSRVTGYGIVYSERQQLRCVAAGVIQPPRVEPAARLGHIHTALTALILEHRPTVLAIERVFIAKNAASALMLGQARGVVLACAGSADMAVSEYSASQIKQGVVGSGRARKEQVQHMVGILLAMDLSAHELDTTDALAAAICHAHGHRVAAQTGLPAGARWSRARRR